MKSTTVLRWLFVTGVIGLGGCASAPDVHDSVVGALKDLASRYQSGDPDRVLELYCEDFEGLDPQAMALSTAVAQDGIARAEHTGVVRRAEFRRTVGAELERFDQIKKAKHVLRGLEEEGDGYEVETWFNLYAKKHDGDYYHEESVHRLAMYQNDEGAWRIRRHEVVERHVVTGHDKQFIDRAADVGLAMTHQSHVVVEEDTPIVPGNFSGSGASAGDLDGDGWLDLVVGDGHQSRLYRNKGDGSFEDMTAALGDAIDYVRGAYMADLDGDGQLDLLFTRARKPLVYLRNTGGFGFENKSELFAHVRPGQFESAAFGDLDGDGDLDAYVVRYGDFEETSWAYPLYDATDGVPSAVLRNDGAAGFVEIEDDVLTSPGWGLAVSFADYDNDGDLDIYKVNDFGYNHLLRNDGDMRFTDVSEDAGVSDQGFGMSSAFGDFDGDGDLDIYVANMFSSSSWVFDDPDYPLPTIAKVLMLRGFVKDQMSRMLRGNSFYENQGNGTFKQIAAERGVERAGWAWGANFLDYDNDGDLDIYSPAGFITGDDPHDC